jgi:hypothetical protein
MIGVPLGKKVYIHEHEQFNLLIRFSILTKLMTRIDVECCDKCLFHHIDDPIS